MVDCISLAIISLDEHEATELVVPTQNCELSGKPGDFPARSAVETRGLIRRMSLADHSGAHLASTAHYAFEISGSHRSLIAVCGEMIIG